MSGNVSLRLLGGERGKFFSSDWCIELEAGHLISREKIEILSGSCFSGGPIPANILVARQGRMFSRKAGII